MFEKPQRGSTALVNGFDTGRVISKEGAVGTQDGRVEGTPAGPQEDGSAFEEVKLIRRKAERLPIEQHRHGAWRSRVDTAQQEIATGSGAVAEFGVEWQGVQPVERAQGSRVRIIGRLGPNYLVKRAHPPHGARAEKIADPGDFIDHCIAGHALGDMAGPSALGQCGPGAWLSGVHCILSHPTLSTHRDMTLRGRRDTDQHPDERGRPPGEQLGCFGVAV
jgi:hypothetical protein